MVRKINLAHTVLKHLFSTHPYKSIKGSMIIRSLTFVTMLDVQRHFLRYQIWFDIKECTQGRSRINAPHVKRVSQAVLISSSISWLMMWLKQETISSVNSVLRTRSEPTCIKAVLKSICKLSTELNTMLSSGSCKLRKDQIHEVCISNIWERKKLKAISREAQWTQDRIRKRKRRINRDRKITKNSLTPLWKASSMTQNSLEI